MIQTLMDEPDDKPSDSRLVGFECPICQSTTFGTWAFPHPLIVHWVLNPGLVVNELLLGQRIPSITYFCSTCGSDTTWVRYYQCPDCGRFHEEAIWTRSNGFGHWLGVICPDCGGEIPSVLNITSWLILAKLSPINWVLRQLFSQRYVAWEQIRAQQSRQKLHEQRAAELKDAEQEDLVDDLVDADRD